MNSTSPLRHPFKRQRTIPGVELDEETERILLQQCGSPDAAAAFLEGGAVKEEKDEVGRLKAEVGRLQEENAALRVQLTGWRDVSEAKKTLETLVTQNSCDENIPKWVEFLQNGELVCQLTAETTRDIVSECVSNILTQKSDIASQRKRREARQDAILAHERAFTQTREAIQNLPKGSRKGEAVEKLLRLYSEFLKTVAQEHVPSVKAVNKELHEVSEQVAGRKTENIAKIAILEDKERQNRDNLEGFVDNVTHLMKQTIAEQDKMADEEVRGICKKAEEVYNGFTDRLTDFSEGVERLLDEKEWTKSRLAAELEYLEEMDPRGEPITRDLDCATAEATSLSTHLASLTALRDATDLAYSEIPTQLAPRPGNKRKRSPSAEFHSCPPEEYESCSEGGEGVISPAPTNPLQWVLKKLSPF